MTSLVATFNEAFSDYFVPFHVTEEYLSNRMNAARVDYSVSVGAFEGDHLVAFVLLGIDMLDGKLTAHNAGTGVIPSYRGQRLVARLYAYVLPDLKRAGVMQSTLEVITKNEKAINAYNSIGYKIKRMLLCFAGHINAPISVTEHIVTEKEIPWHRLKSMNRQKFTWELSDKAVHILSKDYVCISLIQQDECKAYAIVNPCNGFVAQCGFEEGNTALYGPELFAALGFEFPFIRLNNVDERETALISVLKNVGLENHIDQYEMIMAI